MYAKIVVGTDGSPDAERALGIAADMAKLNPEAEVHVVTAFRPRTAAELREIAAQLPAEYHDVLDAHSGAERTMSRARSLLSDVDDRVSYHEIDDDPTDAILETAERVGADLVVVGSRGEGLAKRAIHGSVSTKVLHHAACSVLVAKS